MFKLHIISKQIIFLLLGLFFVQSLTAQDCNSLYLSTGVDGNVYSINPSTGSKTLITSMSSGKQNLAVGADPLSTGNTVFTTSQTTSGSSIYKTNANIGTTLPTDLGGLSANPNTGATLGYVYGINTSRQLIQASPAPAANLGTISGDATWNGASIQPDVVFDESGNIWAVATSGSSHYLYIIDPTTLIATQKVQISGTFPTNYQGLAFYNGRIYAAENFQETVSSGLLGLTQTTTHYVRIFEINPNSGQSTLSSQVTIGASSAGSIDLASCAALVPPTGPSCNELYGIVGGIQTVYNIDPSNLATTALSSGNQTNQGNMALGPIPSNLLQNQFVTSTNNADGAIYTDVNGTSVLSNTGNTIGSPIGLGTDPATGIVWGINSKVVTQWTGTGNGTTVGTVTGDATWTSGTTLNDIAVDANGNLYCIIFNGSNTYLYRIDPATLIATQVVQATGTFITNGTSANGNGLAYLGDYFYYSRITGSNTDIWRLNAYTGVSTFVGTVTGLEFGDLGSCGTVTNIKADFSFDCALFGGNSDRGIEGDSLLANGTTQDAVLRIPVSGAVGGIAEFTVTGAGVSTDPSPITVPVEDGSDFVYIPIVFDGSGLVDTRSLTVTSSTVSGSCDLDVDVICAAAGTTPTLDNTSISNVCPTNTVNLNDLYTNTPPAGTALVWFTNNTHTAPAYSTPTTAATGATYYAFYYDANNDCYGPVSAAVTATTVSCCSAGDAAPSLIRN